MPDQVQIRYLEMLSAAQLKPKYCGNKNFRVVLEHTRNPQINKQLYNLVGADWKWVDKADWSDNQWRLYVQNDSLKTFIAYLERETAGYYELLAHPDASVEINYFGLAPGYIGKGYGGHLLTHAVKSAWEWPAQRVWLHTCTLDHPHALQNYLARGFRMYKTESAASPV